MTTNRNWCDHIVPAGFDEYENPIGICCELLRMAEGKVYWMKVEMGLQQEPTPIPRPVPVR